MYHQSWGCVGRRRGKYLASFSHDLGGMCCDNHRAKARSGRENVYSCAPAGKANPPPPKKKKVQYGVPIQENPLPPPPSFRLSPLASKVLTHSSDLSKGTDVVHILHLFRVPPRALRLLRVPILLSLSPAPPAVTRGHAAG